MRISELDTPALVIDLDIMERNLQRVADYARSHDLRVRPHIKTHKSPVLAKMQVAAGARGITCQKLGEAEVMVDGGIEDILISYNILGEQKVGPGAAVTVAVRPEKVHLEWQPPGQAANAIIGRVDAEAYFGDRSHYYIEVPGLTRRVAVALQNAQRSLDNAEARGRQVWLTWPTESSVLLPRE